MKGSTLARGVVTVCFVISIIDSVSNNIVIAYPPPVIMIFYVWGAILCLCLSIEHKK
jgi:hypothetical protein